jgi:hypothetical protein
MDLLSEGIITPFLLLMSSFVLLSLPGYSVLSSHHPKKRNLPIYFSGTISFIIVVWQEESFYLPFRGTMKLSQRDFSP